MSAFQTSTPPKKMRDSLSSLCVGDSALFPEQATTTTTTTTTTNNNNDNHNHNNMHKNMHNDNININTSTIVSIRHNLALV